MNRTQLELLHNLVSAINRLMDTYETAALLVHQVELFFVQRSEDAPHELTLLVGLIDDLVEINHDSNYQKIERDLRALLESSEDP